VKVRVFPHLVNMTEHGISLSARDKTASQDILLSDLLSLFVEQNPDHHINQPSH